MPSKLKTKRSEKQKAHQEVSQRKMVNIAADESPAVVEPKISFKKKSFTAER